MPASWPVWLLISLILASLFYHAGVVNDSLITSQIVSLWSLVELLATVLLAFLVLRSNRSLDKLITSLVVSLIVIDFAIASFASMIDFMKSPSLLKRSSDSEIQNTIERIKTQSRKQFD